MICLVPHCGYLSETSRMLEIHRALTARGVPVCVATHGGPNEALLDAAGVTYDIVGPRMDADRCASFVQSGVGQGHVAQSMYSDGELRVYARAEAEYFRDHRVVVAVTGFTLTTLLSSRLADAAVVTEHGCWVPPVYERGLLPSPSEPVRRSQRLLPERVVRWLVNNLVWRLPLYCAGFNRIAAELDVPRIPSVAALVLGDLALVTEAPQVLGIPAATINAWTPAGRRAYRSGTELRCTGPLFAHLDIPLAASVQQFLDQPGPVAYVAITSTTPSIVREVVGSLVETGLRVLVAATAHDLADLASPAVLVERLLPSHLVMPNVDVAVTAGGQGSLQTALASGTPVLGIPLQPEQDLNVALVEKVGAGRWVRRSDAGGPRLGQLVTELLADPQYRGAAQRIQRIYDGYDGAGKAADEIVALASRWPAHRRPAHRRPSQRQSADRPGRLGARNASRP